MKKGINAWCMPGSYSVEDCIREAKKAGFDGLELNMAEKAGDSGGNGGIPQALTLDLSKDDLKKIAQAAEKAGIELPSVSTSLLWKYSLTDSDVKVREKAMGIVARMIDAAEVLGADTVLVVPGVVNRDVSYEKAYKRSMECMQELRKYAEEKKVYIGVENVWNKFLLSPLEMRRFIEEAGSPYVGAYFDVGNVLCFSYPEYWIEILSGLIKKVHVKDFDSSIGNIHGFTNLLQGDVDWKRVVGALREAGYDGYLTAELSPYRTFPEKLAYDASVALDRILSL